jgi:hypothetical protein
MLNTSFKLDRRFTHQARGVLEKYEFTVGVLQDSVHKEADTAQKSSYAGGPTRKASNRNSGMTISEVSEDLRKRTGINIYTQPFLGKKNKDILAFVKDYFELCAGKTSKKRVENLLQAIIRNPILRGDYGRNTKQTAKAKGFNRFMIDTAQLFRAITSKVKVNRVSG